MERNAPKTRYEPGNVFHQAAVFLVLSAKILWGVFRSKRMDAFRIKYKLVFVDEAEIQPNAVMNTERPPKVGDVFDIAGTKCRVAHVEQMLPPRGEFCYLKVVVRGREE
jgi:hypothetical protein